MATLDTASLNPMDRYALENWIARSNDPSKLVAPAKPGASLDDTQPKTIVTQVAVTNIPNAQLLGRSNKVNIVTATHHATVAPITSIEEATSAISQLKRITAEVKSLSGAVSFPGAAGLTAEQEAIRYVSDPVIHERIQPLIEQLRTIKSPELRTSTLLALSSKEYRSALLKLPIEQAREIISAAAGEKTLAIADTAAAYYCKESNTPKIKTQIEARIQAQIEDLKTRELKGEFLDIDAINVVALNRITMEGPLFDIDAINEVALKRKIMTSLLWEAVKTVTPDYKSMPGNERNVLLLGVQDLLLSGAVKSAEPSKGSLTFAPDDHILLFRTVEISQKVHWDFNGSDFIPVIYPTTTKLRHELDPRPIYAVSSRKMLADEIGRE